MGLRPRVDLGAMRVTWIGSAGVLMGWAARRSSSELIDLMVVDRGGLEPPTS